jgi:hypothetical protein
VTRRQIVSDVMTGPEGERPPLPEGNRRRVLGYNAALRWIIDNDDTEFLDDPEPISPSVTAAFCADVFDRSTDEVIRDLQRLKSKESN